METTRAKLEGEVNYNSYNLILFDKQLAFYYLNTGSLPNICNAKHILFLALKMFELGNFSAPEQFETYYQIKLLLTLTHEFFNEHNLAFQEYEKSLIEINKNYKFISDETKNQFLRMMYTISPDKPLEDMMLKYSGANLAVSYQNKRRFIEKKISKGKATDTDIKEVSDMFNSVKHFLNKLYHVTHYRLLYIYYASKNKPLLADMYFSKAIKIAYEYEFSGQIERLMNIRKSFSE